MAAPKENNYWKFRGKHGRDHKYTPESLHEEAIKYFEWVAENPLEEAVLIQRGIKHKDKNGDEQISYFANAPKMRAMTLTAFCLFADITLQTFENYEKQEDFFGVTAYVKSVIYSQKFEGAAASMLNPNIIARDLGLADKKDITHTGIKKVSDLFPSEDELDEQEDK